MRVPIAPQTMTDLPPAPRVFVRRRASSPPEWLKSIPKGSKLVSITFPNFPNLDVLPETSVPADPAEQAQGVGSRKTPMRHALLNEDSLQPETMRRIKVQPIQVQAVFDRWMSADPKKVRQLEKSGTLLQTPQKQVEMESAALDRLSGPEYSHLTDAEKREIVGPPSLP